MSLKYSKDAATGRTHRASSRHRLTDPVLAPEEVLFSRKYAPQRYAEKDIYFAHEDLPNAGRDVLPDSDLLKAVHSYTSHFYAALGSRASGGGGGGGAAGRGVDERSMDETALLAFGMLLEEAARESLGKDGDLVFTEGVEDDVDGNMTGEAELGQRRSASGGTVGFEGEGPFWKRKYAKRRKVDEESG